jgi:hypothetical protein
VFEQRCQTYSLYGQLLTSNVPLIGLAAANDDEPVSVHYTQLPVANRDLDTTTRVLLRRMELNIGGWISHFTCEDGHILHFENRAEFKILNSGASIECRPVWDIYQAWIESVLSGLVMSYVLYLRGTGNIHASAIALPNGAVGFIGVPGTGKSTFATALVRSGFPLLTDDVLPLVPCGDGFEAMPGFPVMGMARETLAYAGHRVADTTLAERLAGGDKVRIPVSLVDGSFHASPLPLRALYLLHREGDSGAECSITTLAPQQAMQALFEHTPCFELLKATSLKFHWDFIAQVVSKIPVKVLSYPTGFANLGHAVESVLREEETSTPAVNMS